MRKRSLAFRSLLVVSLLTIVYTSLFFGSTLAWFVDSTGVTVNTFTMGNLDASVFRLEYDENGIIVARDEQKITNNSMLQFGQELGTSKHLFEPGATFALPILYVKNFSTFPINYKIRILKPTTEQPDWTDTENNITDIGMIPDFYDVLKFYAKVGDSVVDLAKFEGSIPGAAEDAAVESERITIYVHMDEEAGNEYKNMLVSGIQIQFYLYQQDAANDSAIKGWNSETAEDGTTPRTIQIDGKSYQLIDTDGSVTDVRTGR